LLLMKYGCDCVCDVDAVNEKGVRNRCAFVVAQDPTQKFVQLPHGRRCWNHHLRSRRLTLFVDKLNHHATQTLNVVRRGSLDGAADYVDALLLPHRHL
jgi:hypothetical protein